MRLGELLVREGIIDNATLAKALERQIIFGGRIGTNLVEMGAIPEEVLARFLSKVLGVPYAGAELFEKVPQEVLKSLPAEIVEKYLAFPIIRERTRLHVAMKDPNDYKHVDELRFIVGMDVKTYIASEIRINFALEKYYGIKRELRYINILDTEKRVAPAPASVVPLSTPREERPVPAVPVERPPQAREQRQTRAGENSAVAATVMAQAAPDPTHAGPYEALAFPVDREQIADAIVAMASMRLLRTLLFMVRGKEATGWKGIAPGMDEGSLPGLRIMLDAPGIMKDVVEEMRAYKGPVIPVPQNQGLLEALGGGAPLEALACPLVIRNKVMGVLYGDNGQGSMIPGGCLEQLDAILQKASLSFEILILKNKILAGA